MFSNSNQLIISKILWHIVECSSCLVYTQHLNLIKRTVFYALMGLYTGIFVLLNMFDWCLFIFVRIILLRVLILLVFRIVIGWILKIDLYMDNFIFYLVFIIICFIIYAIIYVIVYFLSLINEKVFAPKLP